MLLNRRAFRLLTLSLFVALLATCSRLTYTTDLRHHTGGGRLSLISPQDAQPSERRLFHGVHPGSASGDESSVTDLPAYEEAVGKKAAFVYFSQELDEDWLKCHKRRKKCPPLFPTEQLDALKALGHRPVPFIRLMTRKTMKTQYEQKEDLYTYDLILNSDELEDSEREWAVEFRRLMLEWGAAARAYVAPIYVEWGTEANGEWFWWNARWYAEKRCEKKRRPRGQSEQECRSQQYAEGTRKFRRAFARLREIVNVEAKATNVKWIFHVNATGTPTPAETGGQNAWNAIENYYPGSECPGCVDVVGLSVYGAQKRTDTCGGPDNDFVNRVEGVLTGKGREEADSLKRIGKDKPIFLLEFGQTILADGGSQPDSNCNAGKWAREALSAMFDVGRWPGIKLAGFSWWNESWVDEDDGIFDMRVNNFDLCAGLGDKDRRSVRDHGMECCCWVETGKTCDAKTEAAKCKDLRRRRANLRQSLSDVLDAHKMSVRQPGEL